MTDRDGPADAADPLTAAPADPPGLADPPAPTDPPEAAIARPGASLFTIEGRAAPGLFVVGWLATILGLGLVVIGAFAASGFLLFFLGPTILTIGLVAGAGNQAIERRVRGFAYAGPSPYLVLAAIVAAVYAIGSAIGLGLHLAFGSSDVPRYLVNLLGVAIQGAVFLAILRLIVVGTDALTWSDMGWRRFDGRAVRDTLFGFSLAIPVIVLTAAIAAGLVAVFKVVPESPLPPTGVTEGLIVQLIAGALIAPIAEEAVFRGFAISAWRRTVGESGALVRASLVFALAHVVNVSGATFGEAGGLIVVGFATRIPVALALGWLFLRTRSIWAPIGLHVAFNGILLIGAELATMNGVAPG